MQQPTTAQTTRALPPYLGNPPTLGRGLHRLKIAGHTTQSTRVFKALGVKFWEVFNRASRIVMRGYTVMATQPIIHKRPSLQALQPTLRATQPISRAMTAPVKIEPRPSLKKAMQPTLSAKQPALRATPPVLGAIQPTLRAIQPCLKG